MAKRSPASRLLAVMEPEVEAVRPGLAEALQAMRAKLVRQRLFRPHIRFDANGEPIGGALVYDPIRAAPVIAEAERDPIADAALRMTAREFRDRYGILPDDLARYMDSTSRRGRRADYERNAAIIAAVQTLCDRFGYRPSPRVAKPGARGRISACWIVAAVLTEIGVRTTEKAVLRVWEGRPEPRSRKRAR